MSERKPPFVSFESWVDKKIRQAAERGEFDDLPGTGKPLPDHGTAHHEMWWIKQKMDHEGLSGEALLPTSVRLRKEIERLPEALRDYTNEHEVREVITSLNRRIVECLRAPGGPSVRVGPVDTETIVRRWRERSRQHGTSAEPATSPVRGSEVVPWWRRLRISRRVR